MKSLNLFLPVMLLVAGSARGAAPASDDAGQSLYDAGWVSGHNGGTGLEAWQLSSVDGGYFVASSTGNAGGSEGIDTGGRAWGLWSTNGVTEAVRGFSSPLTTGEVVSLAFDNGYVQSGASVGVELLNAAGESLWSIFFAGGDDHYGVFDVYGSFTSPVPFTGDGLAIHVQLASPTGWMARVTSGDDSWWLSGHLAAHTDQAVKQVRVWNHEAGAGSDYDVFVNNLSVQMGDLVPANAAVTYPVAETGQETCYGASAGIPVPSPGAAFAGQDAQYQGHASGYVMGRGGKVVHDALTGLTWQQTADQNGDGVINAADKVTWAGAQALPATLNAIQYGGYSDWRLPSIKELYSLIDFRGIDPSGYNGTSTTGLNPFIDTNYFAFGYGDTSAGERIIDAQFASSNLYVADSGTLFGVNFADGRIKGYGLVLMGQDKTFYAYCVRGDGYGLNNFVDNGDGTITDLATGLMWQQADDGAGRTWEQALVYAEDLSLAGYQDWRLPNVKEMQTLLDYNRSPDATGSAAIDPLFACTVITNEGGQVDYGYYWSGTTHANWAGFGDNASYMCFGRGLGYDSNMGNWHDVHGAGCQRSDPKTGNPGDYPFGHGPQGDAIRIYNFVRCVRGSADAPVTDTDADGLSDWFEYTYVTNTTAMNPSDDIDGDDSTNVEESNAGTSPVNAQSCFIVRELEAAGSGLTVQWQSEVGMTYRIEWMAAPGQGHTEILADAIAATPPVNVYSLTEDVGSGCILVSVLP